MHTETLDFLEALFAPCEQGLLTFTAIHPDGQHLTPSRHVAVGDHTCLARTLDRLTVANAQGWGAYVAIATRKTNLGRWRRGGEDDLLALPALFVDVDDPALDTLERLRQASPTPSCITATGGGISRVLVVSGCSHRFHSGPAGAARAGRKTGRGPAQSDAESPASRKSKDQVRAS